MIEATAAAPDLLGQLLAGGGSTAQIVMAAVLWRMRDDLREVNTKVKEHQKLLDKLRFKKSQD